MPFNRLFAFIHRPDTPEDQYPAIVAHDNGHRVLIVQAAAYAKYVGDLTVYFNDDGEVVYWIGQPVFLDSNVKQGS